MLHAAGGAHNNGNGNAGMDSSLVLEGNQFRSFVVGPDGVINKEAFNAIWPRLRVLARCSPTDKYTIVRGKPSLPISAKLQLPAKLMSMFLYCQCTIQILLLCTY